MNKVVKIIVLSLSIIGIIATCIVCFAANQMPVNTILESSSKRVNVKEMGAVGDGIHDDTQVIQEALDKARKSNLTVYFPQGTYLITKTLNIKFSAVSQVLLLGEGSDKTKLISSDSLLNEMINSSLSNGFSMQDISFDHQGIGSCIEAWHLNAYRCSFTQSDENDEDLVIFTGSNCRITECSFNVKSKMAYAVCHSKRPDRYETSGIAINSYIIDSSFMGVGNGIMINSVENDNRVEGLKINGNIFTNSGEVQIMVETIFHCDISNNIMKASGGSAIVLNPQGLLVDGLYICSNDIQAAVAGVYEEVNSKPSTRVHISNNKFHDSKYGVFIQSSVGTMIIDNNKMNNIETAGIFVEQTDELIVTDNQISVANNGDTIKIMSVDSKTVISGNLINKEMNNQFTGGTIFEKENTVKK
ncbi:MAG: hypothetical protein E7385_02460 [Ruminococcaceae bacterium]|nr:hypothetical protein [Oscillospiraceae bacterium]